MYQNNPLLRSASETIEYTDEMKKEWLHCAEDIFYFAEKYFFIVEIDKGKHIVTLRDYQKKMLAAMANPPTKPNDAIPNKQHCIVLSSRQIGKSVVCRILLLHFVLFNKDKTAAILANKEKTAHKLMKEFKEAYMQLPLWLQQGVVEGGWNKGEVNFENGMCVVASSTSSNAIRSYSISLLMLDEFAFVPDNIASDFFSSVYPTISSGKKSKVVIVSCVPKDTLLLTENGPQTIGSFIPDQPGIYENIPYNVYGYKHPHVGNIVVNNGEQHTRRIFTTIMDVESTLIHKWYCCRDGVNKLRETKDIKKGDFFAIRTGTNVWGNDDQINFISNNKKSTRNLNVERITEDWAYFFGLFIAEGCARPIYNKQSNLIGGQVYITCGDTADVCELLQKLNLSYNCKDGLRHIISSKNLIQLLQFVGFDLQKKAPEKCIPDRLLQLSRRNIIALLQGIFDGDGYSCKYEGRVGINLSSNTLLKQIKVLLLNLGIHGAFNYIHVKPTKLVKVHSHSYRLQITGQQAKKFFREVGFRFKRKQLNEQFVNQKYSRDKNDIIPFSKKKLRSLREVSINHYKQVQQTGIFKGNYHESNHFNRQTIEKFREQLSVIDHPIVQEVLEMCREDLLWSVITRIENSHNQVFDLSLPDIDGDEWCHSVLYNQVIGTQTPNGMNHFYRMWQKAARGDSGYYPIKINWWEVPGRDENFKQETIANLQGGIIEWNQEYGCAQGDKSYILIEDQRTGEKRNITIEQLYKELQK